MVMTPEAIVLLVIIVFMLHEFEEIIFIKPWLSRQRENTRISSHPFSAMRNISTSTIALLIAEEFILFSGIALAAVLLRCYSLFEGFLLLYSLHLVGHIFEPIRYKCSTPSFVTSVLTLPWCVFGLYYLGAHGLVTVLWVAIWFVVTAIIVFLNFRLIYGIAPLVEQYLQDYSKEEHAAL